MLLLAGQVGLVVGFMRKLWRARPQQVPDDECPPAAVILCVRGNDPSLQRSVQALLAQDYPDYNAIFVFDDMQDPGYAVVKEITERQSSVPCRLLVLGPPGPNASLKCQAVVHAVSGIDEDREIVALIDADTIAHPTWLREISGPFQDPKVGATTGMRWYEPPDAQIGAMVRAIWNTAAIVQMFWYRIPWGGSLALRRNLLSDATLLGRWSASFCEDTLIEGELARQGMNVAIVPSLMMVNYERCTLPGFYNWVTRQLITTRLYHRAWKLVAGHGLATSVGLLLTMLFFVASLFVSHLPTVATLFFGLIGYEVLSISMLFGITWAARRVLREAGRPLQPWGGEMAVMYVLALPVTQFFYALATVRCLMAKKIHWRGIAYQIDRRGQVTLERYIPYREVEKSSPHQHSL